MKYLFTTICLLAYLSLQAQDPRFAQFYAAPDQLNPALTGVYEGQFRFIANYRDQWASVLNDVPFRTLSTHLDGKINIGRNDYLSIGLNGLRDIAGDSKYIQTSGSASLSYMKYLGGSSKRDYYLVAGAQAGVGQRSIDFGNLWFSEQFDQENLAINTNLPSGESARPQSDAYPDFSAGLLWYMIMGDHSFYVGGSMFHINTPNISLYEGQQDRLHERYVGHLGGELSMNNNLSLLPAAAVFLQGPSTDINVGANFRYSSTGEDLAMRIGGWAHLSNKLENEIGLEAFTVTAMLEMTTWMLGLSYDINVSDLTPASNARGAFEASFTYIIAEQSRKTKVNCPKF